MQRELFTVKNTFTIAWMVLTNFKLLFTPLIFIENWYIFYLDYFRLLNIKGKVIYKLRNNIKLLAIANQGDGAIINEIWGEKIYTPKGYEILKGDTVVDIGAHKGYFSIFASCLASQGRVIAFEPFTGNFEILEKNVEINLKKNITVSKLGIAGKKGIRKLFVNPFSMAGISLIPEWFTKIKYEDKKIKTFRQKFITLSDIFDMHNLKKINFLKIDCEGAEYDIFLNAPKKILRKIDTISMEYHQINQYKIVDLIKLFRQTGFNVRVTDPTRTIGLLYAKNRSAA